jgi:hypothetical protein
VTQVRRVRAAVGLVALVVVLTGCRVDTRLDISLRDDGSGTVRTTVTLDADAVQRLGGASSLAQNIPLDDLRSAGWTISRWSRGEAGVQSITLSHEFTDQRDLARRLVDLAGPHGILQDVTIRRERGWFHSSDEVGLVVDVRSPSIDIVHDVPLATRLRAAGLDPALLQAQLAVELKSALHVTVVVHLPGGHSETYVAPTGSIGTVRASDGGTDWNRVVEFGIGLALALLAGLFFLAAGMGVRRNRRRARERGRRVTGADRTPLM